MNSFLVLIFALAVAILPVTATAADGSSGSGRFNFRQKSEKKESSRWTLQEWLAQKERNRMMDLWLAMYAPSPYEFFVEGSYISSTTSYEPVTLAIPERKNQSYSGGLGAYATIVGVEGKYENNTVEKYNDLLGSLNVRIMGNAVQGTHLILRYGLRTRDGEDSNLAGGAKFRLSNLFAGADLNLYLTRFFGLQGTYQHYFATEDSNLGTVTGSRSEAGAFIDFEAVRIFGTWYSDVQKNDLSSTTTTLQRTGVQTGLKFFF